MFEIKGYNPAQPRDPKGTSTGGEWTSSPAMATPDSVEKFRDRLWAASKETGLIVVNGKPMKTLRGTKDQIKLSDEDMKLLGGQEFIHNHPGGGPLSHTDLEVAFKGNLKSIEAFGVDSLTGEHVRWVVTKPAGGWPRPMSAKFAYSRYGTKFSAIIIRARNHVKADGWSPEVASHWASIEIMKKVTESLNLEVKRYVVNP